VRNGPIKALIEEEWPTALTVMRALANRSDREAIDSECESHSHSAGRRDALLVSPAAKFSIVSMPPDGLAPIR
jgi:hypothetical protein